VLTANGYNVAHTQDSVRRALEVWNDEAHSNVTLRWGGNTTTEFSSVDVIVKFVANNGPTKAAYAQMDGDYSAPCLPMRTTMFLKNSLGVPWNYTNFVEDAPDPMLDGRMSIESVVAHELGHIVHSFPDTYLPDSIMTMQTRQGWNRQLWDIDAESAVQFSGATLRQARIAFSADTSISSTEPEATGITTSAGVSVDYWPGGFPLALAVTVEPFSDTQKLFYKLNGQPIGTLPATATAKARPASVAYADPGKIMVLTLDNIGASGATTGDLLGRRVGWRLSTDTGATWAASGSWPTTERGTRTRPVVVYDAFRSNWVAFTIAPEGGRIRVRHKPNTGNPSEAWTAEVDAQDQYVEPGLMNYRYLGEVAIDPDTGVGAMFGALLDPGWSSLGGQIVMMQLTFSGGRYRLDFGTTAGGYDTSFMTSRPFGVGYNNAAGVVSLFWQSKSDPTKLCGSSKVGLALTPYFPAPSCTTRNPTSVSAEYIPITAKWAVGCQFSKPLSPAVSGFSKA